MRAISLVHDVFSSNPSTTAKKSSVSIFICESTDMRWDLNPHFAPSVVFEKEGYKQLKALTRSFLLKESDTRFLSDYSNRNRTADQRRASRNSPKRHCFFASQAYANLPPGIFKDTKEPLSFKSRKEVQKVINHFWDRRLTEYLPTFHQRSKLNQDQQFTPSRG